MSHHHPHRADSTLPAGAFMPCSGGDSPPPPRASADEAGRLAALDAALLEQSRRGQAESP